MAVPHNKHKKVKKMNNDAGKADVMVPVPSLIMARCGCNHAELGVGEVILGMSGTPSLIELPRANFESPRRESRSEINVRPGKSP